MKHQEEYEFILISYGELTLKGRNRIQFENKLLENISLQMRGLKVKVERTHARIYLYLNGESFETVAKRLDNISGISSYSPAVGSELTVEDMQQKALFALQQIDLFPATFKVSVKRANKSFPHSSHEMNHQIGSYILRNTEDLKVDVHDPEVEVMVDIRDQTAYIMSQKFQGAGGLPVGSSGKAMLMLSGGIDSPVAGYLAMKRGLRIEAVHFHSYPFTSERAQEKVVELTKQLSRFSDNHIKLHMVSFTDIQTEIRRVIPEHYNITIMRRIMLRIMERLAGKQKALGIITGDNLGQVASQTLESLHTINEVTNMPIIRPLVTMDKNEIIDIAKKIGSYETSILPYEDCCTIFQPKSPKTKPKREATNHVEERMDFAPLIDQAISETTSELYRPEEHTQKNEIDELF